MVVMTHTFKKEKSHENHINQKKKQQEKTEKNKILQKEVPLELAMVLNEIENNTIQFVCRKYQLID